MQADCSQGGEALIALAALVSFQLSQGRSADELAVLAAFFSVLGDNLALIAARRVICESGTARRMEACKNSVKPIDNAAETE